MTPQEQFPVGSRWMSLDGTAVRVIDRPWGLSIEAVRVVVEHTGAETSLWCWVVADWTRLEDAPSTPAAEPTPEERFPIGSRWRCGKRAVTVVGHEGTDVRVREAGWTAYWPAAYLETAWTRIEDAPAEPAQVVGATTWTVGPPTAVASAASACSETMVADTAGPVRPCEAPGWLGREHDVDATEYGVCRVCGASESDRRVVRRRKFEARVTVDCFEEEAGDERTESFFGASLDNGTRGEVAPTRELAIEELWRTLEAGR